jgi:hypothetical protein
VALSTYTELKAAVADLIVRTDLTTQIVDFITLAESALQTKCKLLEAETTATVTITSGSGTLPTGYVSMRSVYWDSTPDRELRYVTPEVYDYLRANDSGDGYYYTITGSTIKTTPMGSGSVVMTYVARFTALSGGNATNAILTSFPDAYLYGTAMHAYIFLDDDAKAQKFAMLFSAICDRINENNQDRKYGGSTLQVRAR